MLLGTSACSRQQAPPNVFLISLDTLRADHLSFYGYERQTSPFLDKLAARSAVFERAYVNTHGTPPSHATMFTGLYQETHRVGMVPEGLNKRDDSAPDSLDFLSEVLSDFGYATVAVTGGGYVSKAFNFQQGFDVFLDKPKPVSAGVNSFLTRLRGLPDDQPIFGFFHTYEIHSPYAPPTHLENHFGEFQSEFDPTNDNLVPLQEKANELSAEDIEHITALYDAGILYTDQVLERLFDELEANGFLDNAVVIITSDHGEEFGEHGGLLHGASLYEELIRIPLVVFGKSVEAKRHLRTVSLLDLAPTIYDITGASPHKELPGRSLLAEPLGDLNDAVFFQYTSLLYGVIDWPWKLIRSRQTMELYDLEKDPAEKLNLAEENLETSNRLDTEIDQWLESVLRHDRGDSNASDIEDEKLEELRSLGYVE